MYITAEYSGTITLYDLIFAPTTIVFISLAITIIVLQIYYLRKNPKATEGNIAIKPNFG
jgi:hypothetical protein